MNKKIKNQKLFSKLNEQQKVYYKMDLVISDFELRTTELIHEICDKMESIIKDKTSYRERVTQKQIDEGFKFYKQLVKMTGYEKGFHRGEAVTQTISHLYLEDIKDMKGVDFSLSFFFAKDGEMIAEVANSLRAMVKIIDAIIYSHLGMSDVIHDLSRKDETDQSTLPDRMSIAEASEESKAGVSLLSWDSAQGIS